jgi:hypothetical protein
MKTTFDEEDIDAIVTGVVEKLKPLISVKKEEERALDKKALAEYLQVPVSWIDKHLHILPHLKLGKYVRFKKSAIDKYVLR